MTNERHDELACLGIFPLKNPKQLDGVVTPILQLRVKFLAPTDRWWEGLVINKDLSKEESEELWKFLQSFDPRSAKFVGRGTPEDHVISYLFEAGKYEFEVFFYQKDHSLKLMGLYDKTQKQLLRRDSSGDLTSTDKERDVSPVSHSEKSYWDRYDLDQPSNQDVEESRNLVQEPKHRSKKYDRLGLDELVMEQTASLWKICSRNGMSVDEFLRFIRMGLESNFQHSNQVIPTHF